MSQGEDKPPRRKRALTTEELDLWTAVIRVVAPLARKKARKKLAPPTKAVAKPPPAPPAAKAAKTPTVPSAPAKPKPPAPPAPVPLGRRTRQRLARGSEAIDARIDLHGLTQEQAHYALLRFLRNAQADGVRIALVITGKGGRDAYAERGVLRRQVPHWLNAAELRGIVVGFEAAGVGHGGEGALYVRLRRARS